MNKPLQIGDYVLATKYHDGDPNDQWAIGFYAGTLPNDEARHMVIDSSGNQFRGNGFRRAKKISAERGRWILVHQADIALYSRSLWWWVRHKIESG